MSGLMNSSIQTTYTPSGTIKNQHVREQPNREFGSQKAKQFGIIFEAITDFKEYKIVYEEVPDASHVIYSSGSIKNEGTVTSVIRLNSLGFANGHTDITLAAGETLKFRGLYLYSVSAPQTSSQSSTVDFKMVTVGYENAGLPEIEVR